MKLNVNTRAGATKGEIKQIRREGNIPAIIYSPGRDGELLTVNGTEFTTAIRNMESGRLSTTTFTLNVGGKSKQAIVKGIQYHPTSYQVIHLDFQELTDAPISVRVPILCTGVADCPGIKLGGFLRQVIPHVQVECKPKEIPQQFTVDVKDLGIMESKRLSDVAMPEGVRPLANLDEVVVVIAKR